MSESAEDDSSIRRKWKEYRERYKQQRKERLVTIAKLQEPISILDCIVTPGDVDMSSFCGTEAELVYAIETLYANDGRDFNPEINYPPSVLSHFGKDFALHARGIYYRSTFSEDSVVSNRKVWVPSLPEIESQSPETFDQQTRARTLANHSKDNEKWCKSEYAWEADAWSDVFRLLRDDPCLTVDKHEYVTLLSNTDPVTCQLTGTSTLVRRTPDATFGLATFTDQEATLPLWRSELLFNCLERLMLHPKYGLISDPRRLDAELSFPFMVYEAKGWSGDCRTARRQACSAAAIYLDMLDHLARRPGQVGSLRPYQTMSSHHYQVFVLTSFGAYWHLLVGYRRPRLSTEHAGKEGMSETVYLFQRIWSGHVIHEKEARELLSLIDQIHLWAITEYRTFVLEHLRPWHQLCEENYLLEWNSKYNVSADKKRKRVFSETADLMVPDWIADMEESSRRVFQTRAKLSLEEAIQQSRLIKGKSRFHEELDNDWTCAVDRCGHIAVADVALIDHLRTAHNFESRDLAQIRWGIEEENIKRRIRIRQENRIMATGHRCPDFLPITPFQKRGAEIGDIFSNSRSKRRKISDPVN